MDVKPGRPDLNVDHMIQSLDRVREEGGELAVFSELCISGYILGDLWEVDAYAEDFARYSDAICAASDGLTVVFGNVAVDRKSTGQDGRLRKAQRSLCVQRRRIRGPSGSPAGPAAGNPSQNAATKLSFF